LVNIVNPVLPGVLFRTFCDCIILLFLSQENVNEMGAATLERRPTNVESVI